MEDCLFCKIRNGEIPGEIVYENDHLLAFNDINPIAPIHILIIPKEHISTLNDITEKHTQTMGELFLAAKKIANEAREKMKTLSPALVQKAING